MNFCLSDLVPPLRWSDAARIGTLTALSRPVDDLPPDARPSAAEGALPEAWWRSLPVSRVLAVLGPEALGGLVTELALEQWPAAAVGDVLPALHVLDPDDADDPQVAIALDRAGSWPGLLSLSARELSDQAFIKARPVLTALFTAVFARLAGTRRSPAVGGAVVDAAVVGAAEQGLPAAAQSPAQAASALPEASENIPDSALAPAEASKSVPDAPPALPEASENVPDALPAPAEAAPESPSTASEALITPALMESLPEASDGLPEASAGLSEVVPALPDSALAHAEAAPALPDSAPALSEMAPALAESVSDAAPVLPEHLDALPSGPAAPALVAGPGDEASEGSVHLEGAPAEEPASADAVPAPGESDATEDAEDAEDVKEAEDGEDVAASAEDIAASPEGPADPPEENPAAVDATPDAVESEAPDDSADAREAAPENAPARPVPGAGPPVAPGRPTEAESDAESDAGTDGAEDAEGAEAFDAAEGDVDGVDGVDGAADATAAPDGPEAPDSTTGSDGAGSDGAGSAPESEEVPDGGDDPAAVSESSAESAPDGGAETDGGAAAASESGPVEEPDFPALLDSVFAGLDDQSWMVAQNRVFAEVPTAAEALAKLLAIPVAAIGEIEESLRARLAEWLAGPEAVPYGEHVKRVAETLGVAAPKSRLIDAAPWHRADLPSLDVPAWQFVLTTLPEHRVSVNWLVIGELGELHEKTRALILGAERPPTVARALELVASLGIHPEVAKEWLEHVPQLRMQSGNASRPAPAPAPAQPPVPAPAPVPGPPPGAPAPHMSLGAPQGAPGPAPGLDPGFAPGAAPGVPPAAPAMQQGQLKDVALTRRCFRQPDGRWWLRVDVTAQHLEGAEISLPSGFAAYLGLSPGGSRTVRSAAGDVTLSWQAHPALGSLQPILTEMAAKEGSHIFLTLSDEGMLRVRHLPAASGGDATARALRLVGYTAPGGTREQACRVIATRIGLPGPAGETELLTRLRERGDRDILSLLG
ncbi:hypothetical protein [Microtetraspora fusca]|uniref:hypothetical protein n=1 Tax=Microtetraspora fusca TaxID=1997 RepID=UPI0008335D57|nr:hypothetical protein [Microtetraspora fusca]